jgi:hypothetical protein
MSVQTVLVELPEQVYLYFQQMAEATRRPIELVVQESAVGNLPPSVDSAPANMRDELLALQSRSVDELKQVAEQQLSAAEQGRFQVLLERNAAEELGDAELTELANLREQADRLMLRKAYAWAVLKWRGVPVPVLDELPLG